MWEYIKFLHFKYWVHGWDGLGPLLVFKIDEETRKEIFKSGGEIQHIFGVRLITEHPVPLHLSPTWVLSGVAQFFLIYLPLVLSGFVLSVVIGIPVSFLRRKV